MDTSDLPDMYAQTQRAEVIQITSAHVATDMQYILNELCSS